MTEERVMSDRLTREQIIAIQKLEAEATKAPWKRYGYSDDKPGYIEHDASPEHQGYEDPIVYASGCERVGDLEFMVALRNAAPALLAAALEEAALRDRVGELETALEPFAAIGAKRNDVPVTPGSGKYTICEVEHCVRALAALTKSAT